MYGDQVYSQAHRPFVLRVLTPLVVKHLVGTVPDSSREQLNKLASDRKKPYRHFLIYLDWDPQLIPEYLVGIGVMWCSLVGFVWALRRLMRTTFVCDEIFFYVFPLVGLALMPSYFAEYYCFLYDFPNLFLFTLGLSFLASRNWIGYLVLYPLSCLNRETTLLLTVAFVLHFGIRRILPKWQFWWMMVYQAVVFMGIRFTLVRVFKDHPGEWLEFHLWRNLSLMQSHTHLFYCLFGVLFILAIAVPYRWRESPFFLRDAFWIGFILFFLDLFFGFLDELRAFYEVYPIAFLLVIFTIGEHLGWVQSRPVSLSEETSGIRFLGSGGSPSGKKLLDHEE